MKQKALLLALMSLVALPQAAYSTDMHTTFGQFEAGLEYVKKSKSMPSHLLMGLSGASALVGIGLRLHYLYKTVNNLEKPFKTMDQTNKTMKVAAPLALFILVVEKMLPLIRVIIENQSNSTCTDINNG